MRPWRTCASVITVCHAAVWVNGAAFTTGGEPSSSAVAAAGALRQGIAASSGEDAYQDGGSPASQLLQSGVGGAAPEDEGASAPTGPELPGLANTLQRKFLDDSGGPNSSKGSDEGTEEHDCQHGVYNREHRKCDCYANWSSAGITDTIHFLQGVCSQYDCVSDEICEEQTNISGATCPVHGWNCYCGWWYAFGSGGTGYETAVHERGGAKCMGLMYTFSFWASGLVESVLLNLWRLFLPLALLLLPFGRKRAICDHHRPSLWNSARRCVGRESMCRGECVLRENYTYDTFLDDLAWSIFALQLYVWCMCFCVVIYIMVLFMWSVVLWTAVIVMAICGCMMMLFAGLAGGGGGDCNCDCGNCGDCGHAGACECGGGDCCCFGGGPPDAGPLDADMFFWSGNFPYDPFWGYGGYGGMGDYEVFRGDPNERPCCHWRTICLPVAFMLYVFPLMPENAWGGLLGLMIGTHQMTPRARAYIGGSPIVEFLRMGWRRRADLHEDDEWRLRVYNFLMQEHDRPVQDVPAVPVNSSIRRVVDGEEKSVIPVGGRAQAVLIDRVFDQEKDECFASSFEDYKKNTCWICHNNDATEWDMWVSCHHLFCSACSTQMLKRRMPCPLCRVASSEVLRGKSLKPVPPVPPEPDQERERAKVAEIMARLTEMVSSGNRLGFLEVLKDADRAQIVLPLQTVATLKVQVWENAWRAAHDQKNTKLFMTILLEASTFGISGRTEQTAKDKGKVLIKNDCGAAVELDDIPLLQQAIRAAEQLSFRGEPVLKAKERLQLLRALERAADILANTQSHDAIRALARAIADATGGGVKEQRLDSAKKILQMKMEDECRRASQSDSIEPLEKCLELAGCVGFLGDLVRLVREKLDALKRALIPDSHYNGATYTVFSGAWRLQGYSTSIGGIPRITPGAGKLSIPYWAEVPPEDVRDPPLDRPGVPDPKLVVDVPVLDPTPALLETPCIVLSGAWRITGCSTSTGGIPRIRSKDASLETPPWALAPIEEPPEHQEAPEPSAKVDRSLPVYTEPSGSGRPEGCSTSTEGILPISSEDGGKLHVSWSDQGQVEEVSRAPDAPELPIVGETTEEVYVPLSGAMRLRGYSTSTGGILRLCSEGGKLQLPLLALAQVEDAPGTQDEPEPPGTGEAAYTALSGAARLKGCSTSTGGILRLRPGGGDLGISALTIQVPEATTSADVDQDRAKLGLFRLESEASATTPLLPVRLDSKPENPAIEMTEMLPSAQSRISVNASGASVLSTASESGTRRAIKAGRENWQDPRDVISCQKCGREFGALLWKNNCRRCGLVFCRKCCGKTINFTPASRRNEEGYKEKKKRVCDNCYTQILDMRERGVEEGIEEEGSRTPASSTSPRISAVSSPPGSP